MIKTLCFVLLFSLIGCKRQHVEEAPLTRAYRLIDAHRTDEAIDYLESLIASSPNNDEYRVALASAYADKAGIRVQRFGTMITSMKHVDDLQKAFSPSPPDAKAKTNVAENVDAESAHTAKMFMSLSSVLEVYSAIPALNKEGEAYVEHAISIMESLSKQRQSDALYRVVLRVIELKYQIIFQIASNSVSEDQVQPEGTCDLDTSLIKDTVASLTKKIDLILVDLAVAKPSQEKQLSSLRTAIADQTSALTLELSSLTVAKKLSKLSLRSFLVAEGFGNLVKCTRQGDTP